MEASEVAAQVHQALLARGETVGAAESLTGGSLADLLSGSPGASATFVGGVVSYATVVKRALLGVTASQVVSTESASQMAVGLRALLGVDWALATTGVAGPEMQDDKPVGTVYVAVAGPSGVRVHRHSFRGDRAAVRAGACLAALEALRDALG
ncbi:MAG: competence protein CinA [Marmoricola sp.]|nr:competence protein CinA [Marmoricola sp.]